MRDLIREVAEEEEEGEEHRERVCMCACMCMLVKGGAVKRGGG